MAFERSAQIGGGVALGSACDYGVAKNQRAGFTQAVGLVQGSTRLDFPQHAQKLRRSNFIGGAIAEIGKDVAGDPLKHVFRIAFRPCGFLFSCHSRAMASKVFSQARAVTFFCKEGSIPPPSCFLAVAQASRASFRDSWGYVPRVRNFSRP